MELAALGLPVRMGIQTGPAEERDGDWFGSALNATARLMDAGSGGQVLVGESTEILVRSQLPERVLLDDLGRHRFRDLGEAQEVFQLVHPDLASEFGPIKSVDFYPNNLPVLATTFIGRGAEAGVVRELLATDRMVTLTGVGGVGKTRLALAVAAREADRFPGGTWFVELASIADGGLIPIEIMKAMSLAGDHRDPIDVLTAHLAEQPTLLVLDNCEHLIDEAAKVAEVVIRAGPDTVLLATSREALGVAGETVYSVPSLRGDDGVSEAVSLFADRARHADPTFEINDDNRMAVAQICERLDGIPLAIELATARLLVMTPQLIAERLDDRFRLLTGGTRTALPRQRTLAAAMDWSYDLLGELEQTLLRRLTVFSGGFDLTAVEAVCTDDAISPYDVLDLLQRLAAASLVTHDADGRYSMLETVRQYAVDKLVETGDMPAWRDRHLEYFSGMAEGINRGLLGPDADQLLKNLVPELDNFRLAMTWGLESDNADGAARIANDVYRLWQTTRATREAYGWYVRILDRVEDVLLKGWMAACLAICCLTLNRPAEQLHYFELAFELVDDPGGSDLRRAIWKTMRGAHLTGQLRFREAYLAQVEAVDYAEADIPDYYVPLINLMEVGASLSEEFTPRYDEMITTLGTRLVEGPKERAIVGARYLMTGLESRGRWSEVAPVVELFEEAVAFQFGPEAVAKERAARGVEYCEGLVALSRGDYEAIARHLDAVVELMDPDLWFPGAHCILAVAGAASGVVDPDAARRTMAVFIDREEMRLFHRWQLMWPAALLADVYGQSVVATRLLGAVDHDAEMRGVALNPAALGLDSELRTRLQVTLPDYADHLGAGAALSDEEVDVLLSQVASGRYE